MAFRGLPSVEEARIRLAAILDDLPIVGAVPDRDVTRLIVAASSLLGALERETRRVT